jgi:hypothetical protein
MWSRFETWRIWAGTAVRTGLSNQASARPMTRSMNVIGQPVPKNYGVGTGTAGV